MAIAKNFVKYCVWGVDRYGFSSATSSPLWTFLLSIFYFITGINKYTPFILNCIIAISVLLEIYLLLRKVNSNSLFLLIVQISMIFLIPIPTLIFCGMEHLLHIFLTIMFVYLSLDFFTEDKLSSVKKSISRKEKLFLTLAFLLPATRYEALFTICGAIFILILKKRLRMAFLTLFFSSIPVCIYGLISVAKGWYFLPNTFFIKVDVSLFKNIYSLFNALITFFRSANIGGDTSTNGLIEWLQNWNVLRKSGTISALIKISMLIFIVSNMRSWSNKYSLCFVIFTINTLLHLNFARLGSFGRYEGYLISFGIFTIAIGISNVLKNEEFISKISKKDLLTPFFVILFLFSLTLVAPLVGRGLSLIKNVHVATKNIYEQQCQMAFFLKEFYKGKGVAANDIGAINYFADIKCLDLWGLASLDVVNLKIKNQYSKEKIYEIALNKDVKIAIVYDIWFEMYGGLPQQWELVGQWKIKDNRVCGGDIVSFYAVDPKEKENLINNLSLFSKHLPKDVIVIPKKNL
ncbi:MAG: hypothetical protein N2053_04230 [Chitinispirillaceae bacterium]|nr:hypothetical protein [Chitinispirillaceae bacterium]